MLTYSRALLGLIAERLPEYGWRTSWDPLFQEKVLRCHWEWHLDDEEHSSHYCPIAVVIGEGLTTWDRNPSHRYKIPLDKPGEFMEPVLFAISDWVLHSYMTSLIMDLLGRGEKPREVYASFARLHAKKWCDYPFYEFKDLWDDEHRRSRGNSRSGGD